MVIRSAQRVSLYLYLDVLRLHSHCTLCSFQGLTIARLSSGQPLHRGGYSLYVAILQQKTDLFLPHWSSQLQIGMKTKCKDEEWYAWQQLLSIACCSNSFQSHVVVPINGRRSFSAQKLSKLPPWSDVELGSNRPFLFPAHETSCSWGSAATAIAAAARWDSQCNWLSSKSQCPLTNRHSSNEPSARYWCLDHRNVLCQLCLEHTAWRTKVSNNRCWLIAASYMQHRNAWDSVQSRHCSHRGVSICAQLEKRSAIEPTCRNSLSLPRQLGSRHLSALRILQSRCCSRTAKQICSVNNVQGSWVWKQILLFGLQY